MTDPGDIPPVSRREVARGAGLAGLARLSAAIEAITQPLYVWMFGLAGYGIYVALWGAISLLTNIFDLSMTSALQRIVPTRGEPSVHAALRTAFLITVLPSLAVAGLVAWNADAIAPFFAAAPEDAARVPLAIALFAWGLPLWVFIEVATSAARARRAFGPEIRLRIFWEQLARLAFAVGFFAAGFGATGLVLAHLCSLALTALLCLPLVGRYYDLRLVLRAPAGRGLVRDLFLSGLALLPSNVSRRMLIDAPPMLLSLMLPGLRGAQAAGLFEVARKLSTVPHIVRQSFQYVLAPLTSAQARADRSEIAPLYHFATQVSAALVIPLAGLMVFTGRDVLSVYREEAMAALPVLAILCAARALEAIAGPAATIVEMTGHRVLPLVNSFIALLVWAGLAFWLVPDEAAVGMAWAVGAGIVVSTWAAAIELRLSDGLSPFGRKLAQCLGVALAGVALMALVEASFGGPVRFGLNMLLWLATSWIALRFGLTRDNRLSLGRVARTLKLV